MRAKGFIAMALLVLTSCCLHGVPISATDWQECFINKDSVQGLVTFHEELADWENGCGVDLSQVSDGVVTVSCRSNKPLKLLVSLEDKSSAYTISNDGTPFTAPLSLGNGAYKLEIMEHVSGISYTPAMAVDVELADSVCPSKVFDHIPPYSSSNGYVPYEEDSLCVKEANRLARQAASKAEFIESVKFYVENHVEYDDDYVPENLSDHEINPDKTLENGKGICLDFASLTAAMLRSQGVPVKLVFGDAVIKSSLNEYEVSEYHAWNEVYLDGKWVILDTCLTRSNIIYQPEEYF